MVVELVVASSAAVEVLAFEGTAVEVCVRVLNPTENEALAFPVFLQLQARAGTAGKLFFTLVIMWPYLQPVHIHAGFEDFSLLNEIVAFPTTPPRTLRRNCYTITITEDELVETAESFTVMLSLDNTFGIQSGVLVQPNSTEIVIMDSVGGKYRGIGSTMKAGGAQSHGGHNLMGVIKKGEHRRATTCKVENFNKVH